MKNPKRPIPWLEPGDPLPPVERTWGADDPVPGLLAAGGSLSVPALVAAYSRTAFPWFSEGEPILWWSPDPRMVLRLVDFKLHRSLKQAITRFVRSAEAEIRFDSAFEDVIRACATQRRANQAGTWIGPRMIEAYVALHRAGIAHSVETWVDGRLVGGLYCVGIGRAVFGESMFTTVADGSKIALAALVAFGRQRGIELIDCQQNTPHLASLGAREMPRAEFARHVAAARESPRLAWQFDSLYWFQLSASFSGTAPEPGGAGQSLITRDPP